MEIDRAVHEAEFAADNAWNAIEQDPLAVLRDEPQRRRLTILTPEATWFNMLLQSHISEEKNLMGPTSEGWGELDALTGIEKAFRQRKVLERSLTNKQPTLETVVLSGAQVAKIHDLLSSYPYGKTNEKLNLKPAMDNFSSSLVRNFPTSPLVAEKQGRFRRIVNRITRHGK